MAIILMLPARSRPCRIAELLPIGTLGRREGLALDLLTLAVNVLETQCTELRFKRGDLGVGPAIARGGEDAGVALSHADRDNETATGREHAVQLTQAALNA